MIPIGKQSASARVKVFWTVALLATFWGYFGAYRLLFTQPNRVSDFFQEWASARNYFEGLPIYTPQADTALRYLNYRHDPSRGVFVAVNGHPPASVLVVLPLGRLDYAWAFAIWNLASLAALVVVLWAAFRFELGTAATWHWAAALAVVCGNPLMQHLTMGQMTLFLALLIAGVVWADDRGRPVLAGVLLGTAIAMKLFPAFLLVYFVMLWRLRTVVATIVAATLWTAAAWLVLGSATFSDYVNGALPEVLRYRDWFLNYSLSGMWFKLFYGASGQARPIYSSLATAQWGAAISSVLLVAVVAAVTYLGRQRRESRRTSFATAIIAMLLISPITWDHYFLLLIWPLVRLGLRLPKSAAARLPYYAALFFFWLNPLVPYMYALRNGIPSAGATLSTLSWPFYSLLAMFVLGTCQAVRESAAVAEATTDVPSAGRNVVAGCRLTPAVAE